MSDDAYYLMRGGKHDSAENIITCPSCGQATSWSFPAFDCEHCRSTITFVVAEKGSIPSGLKDWAAAQSEFQELRYQVMGQEEFVEEHEERLNDLEETIVELKDRYEQLESAALSLAQESGDENER